MPSVLQALVDELADELDRTVTIDDKHWRLLAYSALHDDLDDLRLEAILHRDVPSAAKSWARALGLAEASEPVRVPANPAVGAEPRVVIPLRRDGVLLAYMTLLDRDRDIGEAELAAAGAAAERAADHLYREQLVEGLARGRERELLRDLLSDDSRLRLHAAGALREENLLARGKVTAVVVVAIDGGEPGAQRHALEHALERVRRRAAPGGAPGLVRVDDAVVLATTDDAEHLRALARELLAAASDGDASRASVGIGAPLSDLAQAPAGLRQALAAARVAARVPRFAGLASWEQLGTYAMLAAFARREEQPLHPAYERLRAADRSGALVHTLETYLDHGGDAKATAAALTLHRAGLYYRLSRIAELAGVDLRDGETRLGLHLSLKLARLEGERGPAAP